MADDPINHVLMELLPGDMQFINNYHVLHGRTAYEDDRAAGHIRHLKRLWLETTVLTSRPPYFANHTLVQPIGETFFVNRQKPISSSDHALDDLAPRRDQGTRRGGVTSGDRGAKTRMVLGE